MLYVIILTLCPKNYCSFYMIRPNSKKDIYNNFKSWFIQEHWEYLVGVETSNMVVFLFGAI